MSYDYNRLDPAKREVIQHHTKEIRRLIKRAAENVIETGEQLISVKEALPHGEFSHWLQEEFEWKERTAQNFMCVAREFRFVNFAHLQQFAPSALYLLAAPATPTTARQEALAKASNGETVTYTLARDIVDQHREEVDLQEVQEEEDSAEDPTPPIQEPSPRLASASISGTDRVRQIMTSSKSDEHYTPAWIWKAALEVFGVEVFDLDPCSNSKTEPNVPAKQVFTKDEDGLSQEWHAETLWMNHPYSESAAWINKLCTEYESGRTKEAIALIKIDPSTQWFQKLKHYPICFLHKRVTFINNNETAVFASGLAYLGSNLTRFIEVFAVHGDIWIWIQRGVA